MGGHPWFYMVDYEPDVAAALHKLREREFRAGRYNPVEDFPRFPVDLSHAPGCGHASIEEAFEEADADGTRSILDIERVGAKPDFGVVAPLDRDELLEFFGTERPTRAQIEENDDFFDEIERGQGVYVIAYDGDAPAGIFFAGYSYD